MKNILFLLLGIGFLNTGQAQYASDLFKFSNVKTNGTSRFQSLGGNHVALGADASNLAGNPAGLGFYSRTEFSLGLNVSNNAAQSRYITGDSYGYGDSKPTLNSLSLIVSRPQKSKSLKRTTWGISRQVNNDLGRGFSFSGANKASSLVDYYVEKANRFDITQNEFNDNIDKFGTVGGNDLDIADATLFYQGYLVNPSTDKGAPYFRFDENATIDQSVNFKSTGRVSQTSVGYAENYNNKMYWGVSAVFSNLNYGTNYSIRERNSPARVFNGFELTERLNVNGSGIGVNAGVIYKLSSTLQVGGTYQSPFWLTAREGFIQSLTIDPRSIPAQGGGTLKPDFLTLEAVEDARDIDFKSPARLSVGATMFLPNKLGFLTGTLEQVAFNKMRATVNDAYFNPDGLNSDTKNEIAKDYKSTLNVRLGAEINISKFKIRGGLAYVPSPLKNESDNINRNIVVLSAGAGIRNSAFFLDAGVNYSTTESAFTPYKLANSADYSSAKISAQQTNLNVTVGRFF